jgi:hypothetical protein
MKVRYANHPLHKRSIVYFFQLHLCQYIIDIATMHVMPLLIVAVLLRGEFLQAARAGLSKTFGIGRTFIEKQRLPHNTIN